MKLMKTLSAGVAAIAITTAFTTVVAPTPAHAQQTDASIRGTVISADGSPLSGATVSIVHAPSGTASSATTSANGTFFESGLRVGGPYTLTVSAPGFEPEVVEGVYLEPGSAQRVVIDLRRLATSDEIIVLGTRAPSIDLNNGAGSAFDASDIANQPSVTRDVVDTLVRDPLVNRGSGTGEISIAGVNPRYNALALDGVLQGDDFGLSSSIYPTARSPISLDSIESASVVASSYDVESSGFQGGLINVVTKSGTNEFHGSGYWFRSGQNFLGEISDGTLVPASEFKEREWGLSLGGPVIKDKLFFFASYENFKSASPANFAGTDAQNGILDPTTFYSTLNDRIQDGTNFNPGGRPGSTSLPTSTKRFLGKIDWNINEDHRLEASYQRTRETGTSVSSTSFTSAWYDTPQDLDTYSGGIYSDWTDNFSTALRVGYKDNVRGQNCRAGSDFSEIQLQLEGADVAMDPAFAGLIDPVVFGDQTFVAGCDRFRHGNEFDDNRLQIFASGNYEWQDHVTTFGGEYENYELRNLFLSDSNGTFIYESLDELDNNTGVDVAYRNVITNDKNDAAATWGYSKMSLFVQDEWQFTPNFAFNVGVRYERFFQSDEPPARADFMAAYGRTNTDNLDGVDIIQPRFGFNYEPFDRTTISGGFGLFSGGNPQVWVSNAFQPQIFSVSGTFDGVTPGMIPSSLINEVANSDPTTPTFIDTISPDFKIPSQWKGSVRLTQGFDLDFGSINLGTDYQITVQYLYSKIKDDFVWRNLAQTELGLAQGVAPDGRPIYANLQEIGVDNAVELGNVSGGRSHIFSVALAKQYENGFNFDASYAYQDVDSVTPGTSSRAVSNWRSLVTFDRNNPEVGTAPFETKHAFNINLGYENNFFGDLITRLDLFGSIQSGDPFSYVFNVSSSNPLFGRAGNFESPYDNDLLYIPAMSGGMSSDAGVVFASGFDGGAFESFVNEQGYEQGAIIGKNSRRGQWNQLWSFRFQQDLPFANFGWDRLDENRLKLVVDIFNVANLINDKWGTRYDAPGFDTQGVVIADLVSADDVAMNGIDGATALTGNDPATVCVSEGDCLYRYESFSEQPASFANLSQSVYKIRVGIRLDF
ncbi:TonB-dependent receptor [Hyphococcus luteus]|uniref:TonB-dependent transporter Oar-like beta-barrel domain-containing protein n=1 Tax=Hyphococcus luteus TaxID=2058213 RepID=A0A2S7K4V9_9PROT|nr:TonB-dependent receptor [Marinicaulis flavus]PQA87543.1 hypothetical protein CW354_12150 [Marinicaulis flavus]